MSRWLLALLFAFGTVTFLTGCPAEEETETPDADDVEEVVEDVVEEGGDVVEDVTPE